GKVGVIDEQIKAAFTPAKIVKVPRETGLAWKQAGIEFCENNGWDWPGNAYLLSEDVDLPGLLDQLEARGISGQEHLEFHDGYQAECFGFDDHLDARFDCLEMQPENLEICAAAMQELGIDWAGWPDAPSFLVLATEAQLDLLAARLQGPIHAWRSRWGISS